MGKIKKLSEIATDSPVDNTASFSTDVFPACGIFAPTHLHTMKHVGIIRNSLCPMSICIRLRARLRQSEFSHQMTWNDEKVMFYNALSSISVILSGDASVLRQSWKCIIKGCGAKISKFGGVRMPRSISTIS